MVVDLALSELLMISDNIDERDMCGLCRAIRAARYVICYGIGNEGLMMHALAWNLNQLGFKAFYPTDTSMPPISDADLFLVSAGPSFLSTVRDLFIRVSCTGSV